MEENVVVHKTSTLEIIFSDSLNLGFTILLTDMKVLLQQLQSNFIYSASVTIKRAERFIGLVRCH